MQEFEINKTFAALNKAGLIFFIVLLVFGLVSPFLPGESGTADDAIREISISTTIFLTLIVFAYWTVKRLPRACVRIDETGLWYRHLGRERGLVPWKTISGVKERGLWQCLDLLNDEEEKLLRVEYQLNGFEKLRMFLSERICTEGPEFNCSDFFKPPLYHLSNAAFVVGVIALGLHLGVNESPLFGFGAMSVLAGLVIRNYLVTATGIRINRGSFDISYPSTKRTVPFSDIESIAFGDESICGSRSPFVRIISNTAKNPIELRDLGVDSIVLLVALTKATQRQELP